MTLSGTITATALRTDFDALTASIPASDEWDGDFSVPLLVSNLADTTTARDRSIAFTPQDDYEVRGLFLRVTDGTASRIVTATLTQDNDGTTYLLDGAVSVSVTTINGTVDSRPTGLDLRTVTGTRIRLVKGVRYRLSVQNTSAGTTVTGPVLVMLQLRGVPRGGDRFVVTVPHRFTTGQNLDVDKLNDNLRAIADDVNRSLTRRRIHSFGVYFFDGITEATAQVLREVPLRLDSAAQDLSVVGVEVVLYATNAVDWTATPSESGGRVTTVTGAGATVEAHAASYAPFVVDQSASDSLVTLATAGTSTVTKGYIVVHFCYDRLIGGAGDPGENVPEYVSAATADLVASLNTSIAAFATTLNTYDLASLPRRFEVYTARAVGASSVSFRAPSGVMAGILVQAWAVGPAAHTARVTVGAETCDVNTTGSTNRIYNSAALTTAPNNDPTDTTDDTVVTLSRQAGASPIDLIVALVHWETP